MPSRQCQEASLPSKFNVQVFNEWVHLLNAPKATPHHGTTVRGSQDRLGPLIFCPSRVLILQVSCFDFPRDPSQTALEALIGLCGLTTSSSPPLGREDISRHSVWLIAPGTSRLSLAHHFDGQDNQIGEFQSIDALAFPVKLAIPGC